MYCVAIIPFKLKAQSVLVINPYRTITLHVSLQLMQFITWRNLQIIKFNCCMNYQSFRFVIFCNFLGIHQYYSSLIYFLVTVIYIHIFCMDILSFQKIQKILKALGYRAPKLISEHYGFSHGWVLHRDNKECF